MKVRGEFDVDLKPMDSYAHGTGGINLGRMSIDKVFRGPLEAISKGEMLTAMTPVQGSAGYVAIEQVIGSLDGKKGSFVIQHFGIMSGEESRAILEIVPDSGTDDLKGISGTMQIIIEEGIHFYELEYTL